MSAAGRVTHLGEIITDRPPPVRSRTGVTRSCGERAIGLNLVPRAHCLTDSARETSGRLLARRLAPGAGRLLGLLDPSLFNGLSSSNPQAEIRSRARSYTSRHGRTQARDAQPSGLRAGMAGSMVTGAPCMGCARRGDGVRPARSAVSPRPPGSRCVAPQVPLKRGVGTTEECERLGTFERTTPAPLH